MVGAGSVVTKDVPAGEVWVGNPARYMKKVEQNAYNKPVTNPMVGGGNWRMLSTGRRAVV